MIPFSLSVLEMGKPSIIGCALLAFVAASGPRLVSAQGSNDPNKPQTAAVLGPERALSIFLDQKASESERLAAAKHVGIPTQPDQIERLVEILKDPKQPDRVRVAALYAIPATRCDQTIRETLELFGLNGSPPSGGEVFQAEALSFLIGKLEFSAAGQTHEIAIIDTLRKSLDSDSEAVRNRAMVYLSSAGDLTAEQYLKQAIASKEPASKLFPRDKAIRFAAADNVAKYAKVIEPVLADKQDDRARIAAINALAAFKPDQDKVRSIMLDRQETSDVRIAAFRSLAHYSGDFDYAVLVLDDAAGKVPGLDKIEIVTSAPVWIEALNQATSTISKVGKTLPVPDQVRKMDSAIKNLDSRISTNLDASETKTELKKAVDRYSTAAERIQF